MAQTHFCDPDSLSYNPGIIKIKNDKMKTSQTNKGIITTPACGLMIWSNLKQSNNTNNGIKARLELMVILKII